MNSSIFMSSSGGDFRHHAGKKKNEQCEKDEPERSAKDRIHV
jgi:hypothetical protein